ncbi:SLATT domain-containing protein [Verrucosispora sp. NA02020]|uniref:SLATT domain-containing protein n=1 Tax=Verrucosispora sp. NA02020 TaxID=2742132 RepID=UPI0015924EBB|nr:SLATT domain-containing protein [Verrucosispora sp. NA02020]QKW16718.1 SLATT domain-containing protein [Verrucosispora sp. NA02020]
MSERRGVMIRELDRLYEDASYTAQTYFEAAKSADLWGKNVVFLPAVASAVASILVALGEPKQWGAIGAVAGAIAATAAFLGADRKASSLKDTARKFTVLRHAVRLERELSEGRKEEELEQALRGLRDQYDLIVSTNEIVSSRFFRKASKRLKGGVLKYDSDN